MIRDYGFVEPTIEEDHYVLGGLTSLPMIVLCPNGQWDNYLPAYEPQSSSNFDTYGCTVFGTQNAIETLLKHKTWDNYDFSERYNYIDVGIRPPGADPHKAAESIRKIGLVIQAKLPFTATYEEFIAPDPLPDKLVREGKEWGWDLKHEWLWKREPGYKDKVIKNNLRYSPLCVSVTAWHEENGVYVDKGQRNTHWCLLYGWNDKGWKVFDSYNHSHKILSYDHKISYCKAFRIYKKSRTTNWFVDLWKRIFSRYYD